MHFSFLPTFQHRIIALADGCHPYTQCDQPIGDNFSLPLTGCLVALLSLILLYLKHGTAIGYEVSVSGTVDGNPQGVLVGVYSVQVSLAYRRAVKTHTLYTMIFVCNLIPCWDYTRLSSAEKDRDAFSMRKEIFLSRLHPSERILPRYTKECTTSNLLPSTKIIGSI